MKSVFQQFYQSSREVHHVQHDMLARRVQEIAPEVIQWRHQIHQNPELSFHETATSALIEQKLRSLESMKSGVSGHQAPASLPRSGEQERDLICAWESVPILTIFPFRNNPASRLPQRTPACSTGAATTPTQRRCSAPPGF